MKHRRRRLPVPGLQVWLDTAVYEVIAIRDVPTDAHEHFRDASALLEARPCLVAVGSISSSLLRGCLLVELSRQSMIRVTQAYAGHCQADEVLAHPFFGSQAGVGKPPVDAVPEGSVRARFVEPSGTTPGTRTMLCMLASLWQALSAPLCLLHYCFRISPQA